MNFNSVPTVCTAKHITGFSLSGLDHKDPIEKNKSAIMYVNSLTSGGYYKDFAMLFIIITDQQRKSYNLDWFLEKCGFKCTFEGMKEDSEQRHKESGHLSMWCTEPRTFKEATDEFKKELKAEQDKLNRRAPDPKRQEFPDILMVHFRKTAKMVFENARVDNPIEQILTVDKDKFLFYVRKKFGFDPSSMGEEWARRSFRQLKDAQQAWKQELIPY